MKKMAQNTNYVTIYVKNECYTFHLANQCPLAASEVPQATPTQPGGSLHLQCPYGSAVTTTKGHQPSYSHSSMQLQ